MESREPARKMFKLFSAGREVRKTTVEVKSDHFEDEEVEDADDDIAEQSLPSDLS